MTTIGSHRIERELGRGGMGVVYLARDTRLDRFVAIKAVPDQLAGDPDRLVRFEREAKIVASLNHSGIAAVYALEEHESKMFLVMEYVEGETLAARLKRGCLPAKEALQVAIQIAEALDAAHDKGVIHRDLKPGNVMLTPDGKVKVLDFGLARTTDDGRSPSGCLRPADANSPTLTAASPAYRDSPTMPGAIMGTAGYMSPEQARGKPVDKRCDIFSLGCVLYEMITGRVPFPGETTTDVLAAVVGRDPDWSALPVGLGPNTRRLLSRCLEKDPRRRYRDIGDVAFDLAAAPALDSADRLGSTPSKGGTPVLLGTIASVSAVALIVLGILFSRQPPSVHAPPRFEQLTFAPQFITNARFTPDSRTVVFSAARLGNSVELFVRSPEDAQPRGIGAPNFQLLSVSSKGELAILVRSRYWCHHTYVGMLARMPLTGGAPREVLDDVTGADWSPEGAELAIVRRVGPTSRLEYPEGSVLWETPGYISALRFSPNGDHLAYITHAYERDNRGGVVVIDRKGRVVTQSAEYWGAEGLTWSSNGTAVLFSSALHDNEIYTVRELSLNGAVRDVLTDHAGIVVLDAARDGRLLATDYDLSATIVARFAGAESERELPWLGKSFLPIMTPDGRSLVFSENSKLAGNHYAVCLQPADGSPPVRLGDGMPVDISPDGASVLALIPSDPPRMVIYPTGAGTPRDISDPGFTSYDFSAMRFTADGRAVLYSGTKRGKASQGYLMDLASGVARPVTPEGANRAIAFPDGREIVARTADGCFQRFPIDGGSPSPVAGLDSADMILGFRPDGRSLLAVRGWEMPCRIESIDLATGHRTLFREIAPQNMVGAISLCGIDFSSDEESYAYSIARSVGTLFVVEGVR